ncbi:hypothetical protein ABXT00_02505 [Stenotrophomonas koreensis]|uniref:hypothetical protein n=1 Tax=Stenotrophomonas koreensis TaxID=266128 RepID=UPI003396B9DB
MIFSDLVFTPDELSLIDSESPSGVVDWSSAKLVGVRRKVRDLHRAIQRDCCCYCRKDFAEDHPLAIDIEHVLPKSKRPDFCVNPVNLSVACKRCNMHIKRDRVDFLAGSISLSFADAMDSSGYLFIHPNLDCYSDHLRVLCVQVDNLKYRKYCVLNNSAKGRFNYDYFLLIDLERGDIDEIQGVSSGDSWVERELNRIQGV